MSPRRSRQGTIPPHIPRLPAADDDVAVLRVKGRLEAHVRPLQAYGLTRPHARFEPSARPQFAWLRTNSRFALAVQQPYPRYTVENSPLLSQAQ